MSTDPAPDRLPQRGHHERVEKCGRAVGSKPWWMGVDQYDPCPCVLDPGHEPPCRCSCGVTQ